MMKKKYLVMVLMICVFVGCGTATDSSVSDSLTVSESVSESKLENESDSKVESGEESETSKEETVEEVSQGKIVKIKEGYSLKNGKKTNHPVIEYDKKGNEIKRANTHYEYDENGNVTKVIFMDETGTTVSAETEFAYDNAGNKTKENSTNHEYWEEWEYNSANAVSKYIKYRKSDNSISLLREYDDFGEIANAYVYYSDGTECPVAVNEYDEKGRRTKYSYYSEVSPKMYEGCKEYEYNDMDQIVVVREYNFNDELGTTRTYVYDEQGRVVREECARKNYNGHTDYLYEENRNVTKTEYVMNFFDGSEYVQGIETTDSEGNIIKKIHYIDPTNISEWIEYDEGGKLIKRYNDTFYQAEYQYNQGYLEEYQYNEQGLLISASLFRGIEGSEQTGRKEYEYDDLGNVIKIMTYDKEDNLVFWQDYSYDEYNNLICVHNCDGNVDQDTVSKVVITYTYY